MTARKTKSLAILVERDAKGDWCLYSDSKEYHNRALSFGEVMEVLAAFENGREPPYNQFEDKELKV